MDILASLSSGAVTGLFSSVGTLAKDIREAITGDLPADKQAEIQQKLMEIELQASQGQMEINKVEAASSSLFVAGWRPAVGWIGAAGLGYAAIIEPIMTFTATMKGYTGAFPAIDTTITMQILFGILGLGAFRSAEKIKGTK